MSEPDTAKKFAQGLKRATSKLSGVDVWVAPSFTLLPAVAGSLKGSTIKVGAQTVAAHEGGAHTGDVSGAMLKGVGASFVIVGHSERRAAGSTNEMVHQQFVHAAQSGLAPVLCVGETERKEDGSHFSYIEEQLSSALKGALPHAAKMIVAYEPVWAIGKSAAEAMQPAELEETVIFIRKTLADLLGRTDALKIKILYGGSVEGENAQKLIAEGGVNGFLVGHASAQLDSFVEILRQCTK